MPRPLRIEYSASLPPNKTVVQKENLPVATPSRSAESTLDFHEALRLAKKTARSSSLNGIITTAKRVRLTFIPISGDKVVLVDFRAGIDSAEGILTYIVVANGSVISPVLCR